MSDDSSFHLKPLSVYSHMVSSKQQYNANRPVYNIQVHISNKEARARKRRLEDSCFDETYETPLKRQCITRTFSPDEGYFSVDFLSRVQGSTPIQPLIISKNVTPPRSKVNQPVTPVVSTPLSNYKPNQIDRDRESLPSPIPVLKWDREVPAAEISLRTSLNFDFCSSVALVGSQGPVKGEVKEVSHDLIPIHESKSHIAPPETVVPVKEEKGVSVSQQAEPEVTLGNEETTAESFESTLPLQVKSKVVVPDKTTSKPPVFCEEEWERRKKTYVESVKRHMKEKGAANGVITELHTLMNTVTSHQTGRTGPHWQHPSDLTRRNYLQSHPRCQLVSLDEWQKIYHLSYRRFAKVPDIFHRSPVL
ncbi:S100P-binding protein isoform X2 [Sinocyclocheilus rhinocerous]|uniref:S100P-binding protein isoform X2 n=1 Tax=Sinocyclocheilus rhinocerous TaxID=307959 RepID=UPI0007B9F7F1|nr:PREDICTED: S100P-binding protein isoform X2 [Sinocyclocheilus rhinocerous]